MNILMLLMPLALGLGLCGLAAFFWCLRNGQYADMEGPGWRILDDEDVDSARSPVEEQAHRPGERDIRNYQSPIKPSSSGSN